ncbi:hypothetical protein, partial [Proteus terrae]|uniref:hypothetical protein n=3 Tax=Proteus terrae TaxID=1574161 RepID=UPI0021A5AB17
MIENSTVSKKTQKKCCQLHKTPYNAPSLSRQTTLSELAERTKKKVESLVNKRLTLNEEDVECTSSQQRRRPETAANVALLFNKLSDNL